MARYRARRLTIGQVVTGAGVALLFVFIFGPLIWLMLVGVRRGMALSCVIATAMVVELVEAGV